MDERDASDAAEAEHPGSRLATWVAIGAALAGVLAISSIRCAYGPTSARDYPSRSLPPDPEAVLLSAPEMDDEYFPCSDCHEDEPSNRTVRELEEEHDDLELAHGDLWCLDCHDLNERDRLRLANDTTLAFDDAWRLCTQCHGSKLPDWRAGVHGKRTGNWWGAKQYEPCAACHSAHAPRFAPIAPEPPPRRPEAILKAAHATKFQQETAQ